MRPETVWQALLDGSPGVIAAAALLAAGATLGIWLCFAQRPIPPKKGHPTVDAIRSRVEKENARRANFENLALQEAIQAAKLASYVIEVVPVSVIPEPRTSRKIRPYAQATTAAEEAGS